MASGNLAIFDELVIDDFVGHFLIDRIADGKVAESWAVEDLLGMTQQIGAFSAPEQAPVP